LFSHHFSSLPRHTILPFFALFTCIFARCMTWSHTIFTGVILVASIVERKRKDGTSTFLAQITRRKHGYQESRTFDKRKTAEAWAKRRETEVDLEISNDRRPKRTSKRAVTLGDAIDRYISESRASVGKTKTQVLRTIRTEYKIAELPCDRIGAPEIVSFIKELFDRPDLASPATALTYLTHLGGIFSIARPLWGFDLDQQAVKDAYKVCMTMGYTGKPNKRERRPSLSELDKIMQHFHGASETDNRCIPMHKLCAFAIFSTRRQGEICRIRWAGIEETEPARILVRKMKHPGQKGGIDTFCELPDPCMRILASLPKTDERIFPYNSDTVSRRFTDACKLLGIEDLRFHDLRHEGISRLAEMGRTIPMLATASGHKSWQSLERYTHVRTTGDKYEGWRWLDEM
jgi:integrase